MFWADRIAKEIIESGQHRPFWVDDMFTPSGFAHIGSLRGPLVHDIVYRALLDAKQQATFTYVFNDFDPVDGLPPELAVSCASSLGLPLRAAASPEAGYESFAEYFTKDFKQVLKTLGVRATYLSSWDMYHEGTFDDAIRIALDHALTIQDIYQRVSGSKKREAGWLPLQVICEKCGKLGTTRVHDWDGETVAYTCEPSMVSWATGCGYTGRIIPFGGNGKLPWKVDWPAHWKVIGVTIEGAGKDHSSAGGSRDIAKELCTDVFNIPNPYNLPYEFFLIGGKKMSSSKGLGLKGRDLSSVLPAAVGRFLFTRTDYRQAIEIDPAGTMAIPDLFDEYDRCWQSYIHDTDPDYARAFVLSQIREIPEKVETFLPRFRDVANYSQLPGVNLETVFEEKAGRKFTDSEKHILSERETYARIWLEKFAPDDVRTTLTKDIPPETATLTVGQRKFLQGVKELLQERSQDPEKLQTAIFALTKELAINPKDAFAALYTSLIGKKFGPKAAWFLLANPKDIVVQRLTEAIHYKEQSKKDTTDAVTIIHKPEYFLIDPQVKQAYPSVSIGIAYIEGVHVAERNEALEQEKQKLIEKVQEITLDELNAMPEIQSYRTLYKQMGVDWHSRRPSPEALVRRIVQGKGLYTVNTCVDAYNVVVIDRHVSIGAFDADTIAFPTVLRYAGKDDVILLHGDDEATHYTDKELAYYDRHGGYNIDFNYRDAKRTLVTTKTKNIWINVDGVYDISPGHVQKSLDESINKILLYCGGNVRWKGVVL